MAHGMRDGLLDEFERVMLEFGGVVREIPEALYDTAVPGDEGSVRAILVHVVGAGYRHIQYVAENCGGVVPERKFTDLEGLSSPDSFVAALLDVVRYAREALADVEDESFAQRFDANWGQNYDGEQMMEHAVCHPPRHVRQLERFFDGKLS